MGERSRMGPVIFELPTDQANQVDVIVVWEAWKSLPLEARSQVVRDAYQRFARVLESSLHQIDPNKPRDLLVPTPASVTCATWDDLTTLDLLPYKIQPTAGEDAFDPEDARLLMTEVGAIWTPFGVQLRFPNKEMATDVYARLMTEMPEARWSIIESSFGPVLE
ncbi:MAG: hypothetical protein ABSH35_22800 [Isosphaeraceae bacterium]